VSRDATAPTVGFVLWKYLEYTETFLHVQMSALTRYRGVVLCSRVRHLDRFPWAGPLVPSTRALPRVVQVFPRWHALVKLDPAWLRALAAERVSVLHGQFGPSGLRAALYARRLGLPLVTSFYGYDVGYLQAPAGHLRDHWHYVLGRRALFATLARALVLSAAMRDDLVRLGCPEDKIAIHPNGIDLERFAAVDRRERTGPVTVALCGRACEKKGFEYGFRALRQALDAGVELRARWLPAPGPLLEPLTSLLRELDLTATVEILDPSSSATALMASADLILAPSVTATTGDKEGVPTVLIEAAASGLPAVATRHAGIPEIVLDGQTGWLFPERDVAGLAAGLERLARNRELRLSMGRAARALAEDRYDARRLAARLEEHYDEVRERARARPRRGHAAG